MAIGSRSSFGSKISVCVPTQRQRPGGSGDKRTGTPCVVRSSCEVSATIGSEKVTFKLGAEDYLATVVPMPGAYTAGNAGAVVLRSITAARAPAGGVAFTILLATLLGLLIVVGFNLYLAFYMEKPIEQIEDGLLQIINGNREHRINVEHPELGGIVYRVNQLVSELTGVEEEGSGGSSGGGS